MDAASTLFLIGNKTNTTTTKSLKVVFLQTIGRDRYVAYGANQRTNTQVLAADRGAILDRNGAELVISRPGRSIFVDPKLVTDASSEAAQLAPILGLDPLFIESKMNGTGRFAYLARRVTAEVADQVAALGLAGVAFLEESERFAPAARGCRCGCCCSRVSACRSRSRGRCGVKWFRSARKASTSSWWSTSARR